MNGGTEMGILDYRRSYRLLDYVVFKVRVVRVNHDGSSVILLSSYYLKLIRVCRRRAIAS